MIQITDRSIDLNALLPQLCNPDCGAQVIFVGTTRQWTGEIETAFLEYEAYEELALNQMRALESQARQRWPVREVIMVHRTGRVEVSEPSVAVLVASPHRAEAFAAARWLIDELKHHVPIWKQEHYVQRGAQWIHPTAGNCNCNHHDRLQQDAPDNCSEITTVNGTNFESAPSASREPRTKQQQSAQQ
jgi:molybdopterin synthase catalytic subunit